MEQTCKWRANGTCLKLSLPLNSVSLGWFLGYESHISDRWWYCLQCVIQEAGADVKLVKRRTFIWNITTAIMNNEYDYCLSKFEIYGKQSNYLAKSLFNTFSKNQMAKQMTNTFWWKIHDDTLAIENIVNWVSLHTFEIIINCHDLFIK